VHALDELDLDELLAVGASGRDFLLEENMIAGFVGDRDRQRRRHFARDHDEHRAAVAHLDLLFGDRFQDRDFDVFFDLDFLGLDVGDPGLPAEGDRAQ
jgi:hypothetical protein